MFLLNLNFNACVKLLSRPHTFNTDFTEMFFTPNFHFNRTPFKYPYTYILYFNKWCLSILDIVAPPPPSVKSLRY